MPFYEVTFQRNEVSTATYKVEAISPGEAHEKARGLVNQADFFENIVFDEYELWGVNEYFPSNNS